MILALENFKKYFDGTHVVVYTDHASLLWLTRFKESNGRLVRWALRLQQYDITIQHKKGKHMQVPDALSRIYETDVVDCDSFDSSTDSKYNELVERAIAETQNDDYIFERDTLYKHVKSKNDVMVYRIYIPSDRIHQALEECHDVPTAAHGGFHKTLHRLKERYYWPAMDDDTREYVRKCEVCLAVKQASYNLTPPMGKPRIPPTTFHTLAVDFVGPLCRSTSGNRWILTIVDCYSKYTFIQPCRDATAAILVKTLVEKVILTFGSPSIIISSNGSQFKSKMYSDLASQYKFVL